jgi:hypothetical protein
VKFLRQTTVITPHYFWATGAFKELVENKLKQDTGINYFFSDCAVSQNRQRWGIKRENLLLSRSWW